jgi:hypothetical protein
LIGICDSNMEGMIMDGHSNGLIMRVKVK